MGSHAVCTINTAAFGCWVNGLLPLRKLADPLAAWIYIFSPARFHWIESPDAQGLLKRFWRSSGRPFGFRRRSPAEFPGVLIPSMGQYRCAGFCARKTPGCPCATSSFSCASSHAKRVLIRQSLSLSVSVSRRFSSLWNRARQARIFGAFGFTFMRASISLIASDSSETVIK